MAARAGATATTARRSSSRSRFACAGRAGAGRSSATGPGAQVAEHQPVKLAAFEGLPQTEEGAPFTIGGFYDDDDAARSRYGIEIPKLLSLLAHHDPNAQVDRASTRVPPEDRPPVNIVRFAFQTMVGIGTGLALLGACLLRAPGGASGGCRARRGSTAR